MKLKSFSRLAFLSLFCVGSVLCQAEETPDRGSIYVSDAVTAKGVKGDTLTPVDITDTFLSDQNIFHTVVTLDNAPANTKVKTVWINASGKNLGEYELTAGGTRNLDFTFKPNGGTLPTGDYGVDLYVNGVYDSTLRFSVVDHEQTKNAQVKPIVQKVTMALDTRGEEKVPENETDVFKPTDTLHAVVAIANAPANTRFKASWYLVKSDSGEFTPNTLIDTTEITTEGTRNIDFMLTPTAAMPAGSYRVEFMVNGVEDPASGKFTVEP
jgi:hypothetical protein